MSFFDETQDRPARTRRRPSRRGPSTDRQTLLFRRLLAGGVAFVVLLLLVLGIKSCRDSARRDAFKTYIRDVSAIAQGSGQESSALFTVLSRSGKQSPLQLQNAAALHKKPASATASPSSSPRSRYKSRSRRSRVALRGSSPAT